MTEGRFALRSRADQLADYLRAGLRAGQWADPLPGSRTLSAQLGVSRFSLGAALAELRHEGWVRVDRQGVHPRRPAGGLGAEAGPSPVVRCLIPHIYWLRGRSCFDWLFALRDRLLLQGVDLRLEKGSAARLRQTILHPRPRELIFLVSVSPAVQGLFVRAGTRALVLGDVAPELPLPFVSVDVAGTVRHAAFTLLRRGCRHLVFVHPRLATQGMQNAAAAFEAACANWTSGSVTARRVPAALDPGWVAAMARRLTEGVREKIGFVVLAPVPLGVLMTSLMRNGISLPKQAVIAALLYPPELVELNPRPIHYPYPMAKLIRQVAAATAGFFESGELPPIRATIVPEVVPGD